jgi:hypothetical protein
VFARHPKTQFIALHVGNNAENLASVSECLERFPNMHVEIGARIGELGRQPRTARKFFDRFQDRILFGTDAVPNGVDTPQQIFGDKLYEIYYRFLETEDEYFDYAPAPVPPQGRWQIYGLGLPKASEYNVPAGCWEFRSSGEARHWTQMAQMAQIKRHEGNTSGQFRLAGAEQLVKSHVES